MYGNSYFTLAPVTRAIYVDLADIQLSCDASHNGKGSRRWP